MNVLAATPLANGLAETLFMTRRKNRILLVEDCETDCDLAEIMLLKIGCEITIARNGHEAIELVRNNEFDLCIVDFGLPDMTGLDVASQLQVIHPRMNIVIYTGYRSNPSFYEALDSEFMTLGKPLRPQNVLCFLNRPAIGH